MSMTIAMGISFLIAQILCFVLFIYVLIKMFKNEGALKGILGFFCGIYTFVWGWMKHKELALTKAMAVWSILTVATFALVPMMGVSSALEIQSYVNNLKGETNIKLTNLNSTQKAQKIMLPNKIKKRKATAKTINKKSQNQAAHQDVDWNQKAMALWKNGRYQDPNKAINYWNHAIKKDPQSAKALNNRGVAYYDLKLYQKAINDYDQAISLDPSYVAAFNNRGNSFYQQNEYRLALADFNESLRLKPDHSKAHFNRGLVYYQLNNKDQACGDFQRACDLGDCDGIKWAMKNAICKQKMIGKKE
ncbi:MAG: tetratricopeptide repeat protein [Desulfobacterales bacterium]|jgi:regulator of sirC expression with transglutaminase-like and TPR domain